jgi:soluble lytic murein transglycosylase
MTFSGRLVRTAGIFTLLGTVSFAQPRFADKPPRARASASKLSAAKKLASSNQLEQLSRALKDKNFASAYAKLGAIATQKNPGVTGSRAALALGYFDYGRGHYPDAEKWLGLTKADPLLADYSLYWLAATHLAMGRSADALAELQQFREKFPDSIMTVQALQSLAQAAIASNQAAQATAALNAYPSTLDEPELLFLRAQARDKTNQPLAAVSDYLQIYNRFPLTEQGRQAVVELNFLSHGPAGTIPQIPLDQRIAHADTLFNAKNWTDARAEYAQLLTQVSGPDHDRAEMRVLACGVSLGSAPTELAALKIDDPDVDAERYFWLAQAYRPTLQEMQMNAAIESAASRAPASKWTEQALFLGGNYYWVLLNRDVASGYYKRVEENFPSSADAISAQWRVAWVAVLKRDPNAANLVTEHLHRFPGSQYTPDALYWLGRLAEEANDPAQARSYYGKLTDRYPNNYFASVASTRLRTLGTGPVEDPPELDKIPPPPAAPKLGDKIPPAAADRQARADALRSIAFDASAELELRAGYAATHEPRLLLESAQAALAAGHYGAAIVTIRQIYPQIDTHTIGDVPMDAWLAAYALPFDNSIRQWSAKSKLDPMLIAALIHQESAFSPTARSSANALGLMQLEPETARRIAKQAKVRYSQAKLFDPDFNIHIGTVYFSNLRQQFDSVELAVAAYNSGEDRVTSWTTGQTYREPAEFVDSIPFTETRDYVEIVTRNASIYRKLYGETNESRKAPVRRTGKS